MTFTVPVILYLGQIGMELPLAALLRYCFKGGVTWGAIVWGGIHTLVFAPLLWLASFVLVWVIGKVPVPPARIAAYLGIVAGVVFLAWLGPYGVGGHSNSQSYTWLQTFQIR